MRWAAFALQILWLGSTLAAVGQDGLWSEPFGEFAFLPRPRQFRVTPVYTFSRAGQFFDGGGQTFSLPEVVTQNTGLILTEYAIRPYLAADATLGAVGTTAFGERSAGMTDTQFGLRWRLLDEDLKESEPYVPTLTLRLGGIVRGTYDANTLAGPGRGASGLETRVIMSDSIGATGFSIYGDFGWRWLANDVPQQFFGSAGGGYSLKFAGAVRSVTANLGYAFCRSLSGSDLAALPPADWTRLQSASRAIQAGLAATDKSGRRYQVFVEADLDGRNATQQLTIGAYVRFPFKPFPRPGD